ncbi:unnamed protein product [Adineta steineri]|uniref:Uncharacterized protein n=1 Tax=Adineta steineri TaxID=433720 RepID=A0A818SXL1_9BILA|nr:unnamed protein product [Adineta steineri]CAF3673943.1 unnamed protein product [Adineta steineri]
MITVNFTGLVFILFLCSTFCNSYPIENDENETNDDDVIEHYAIQHALSSHGHYPLMNKPIYIDIPSFSNRHNFELEEPYLDWPEKMRHTMENSREKRFWLFAKKDENDKDLDLEANLNKQQNSLTQGLWRSGIVGRRRRR